MSDQEEEAQDQTPEEGSGDSATVQAALSGIPGLAESMGNRPARPAPAAGGDESGESEEPEPQYGGSRKQVEDSETVQQALRQLGLQ